MSFPLATVESAGGYIQLGGGKREAAPSTVYCGWGGMLPFLGCEDRKASRVSCWHHLVKSLYMMW